MSLLDHPCDEHLVTEDGAEFTVHSEVLSSQSEYFRALFSVDAGNEKSTIIHLITGPTLRTVLHYLYTGNLDLNNTDNVLELLAASDYLMIETLTSKCRSFVLLNISKENCLRLFLAGCRNRGLDIEAPCRRFLQICFEEVVTDSIDEAAEMPGEALRYFLTQRSINVSGERVLWRLIEAWAKKDPSQRLKEVPELLSFLSTEDMDDELASEIISSPIVLKLFEDDPAQIAKHKVLSLTHWFSRIPRRVYFVTKFNPMAFEVEIFITYDDRLDLWRKVGELFSTNNLFLITTGRKVYMADMYHYDLLTDNLKPSFEFYLPHYFQYAELSGQIYAFQLNLTRTVAVYRYELSNTSRNLQSVPPGTWNRVLVCSMEPMLVQAVAGWGSFLYAVGIRYLDELFMSMQVYYPYGDNWIRASPPNVFRSGLRAAVCGDKLFLVGGYEGGLGVPSRAVEAYDPEVDEWTFYPDLPRVLEKNPVPLVLDGELFVWCGGGSMLVWDRGWRTVPEDSPLADLHLYRFCAVEDEDVLREVMRKNRAVDASDWISTGLKRNGL